MNRQRQSPARTLLAILFFISGLAGALVCVLALPGNSDTSPLLSLFSLLWSCVFILAAALIRRRSRFAAPAFVAAVVLLLFPARFLVPEGQMLLPACLVIIPVSFPGYRFLNRLSYIA